MIDAVWLRDNLDVVRAAVKDRGANLGAELDTLAELEARRRQLLPQSEGLKQEQNAAAEEVGRAKRQGLDTTALQEATRARSQTIKQLDTELQEIEGRRQALLLTIPNLPHASVPVGASADDNVEMRREGAPPAFSFTPKAHWDLGPALGIIDFER